MSPRTRWVHVQPYDNDGEKAALTGYLVGS